MNRILAALVVLSLSSLIQAQKPAAAIPPPAIYAETLNQATSSWDGTPYKAYPAGEPQITVLRITIPPNTAMKWHSHPLPNAAYVVSGAITVEKKDGTTKHFVAGQVIPETVNTVHRGVTGTDAAVLIVFYPGIPGMALSEPQ